jgi:hypothetical protein
MSKSKRVAVLLVLVALALARPGMAEVGRFPGAGVFASLWERLSRYVLPADGRGAWDPDGVATTEGRGACDPDGGKGACGAIDLKGRGGWDPDGAAPPPPPCDPADPSCQS